MENTTIETTETTTDSNENQGTELSTENIAAALAATRSKNSSEAPAVTERPKRVKMTDEERAVKDQARKDEQAARKLVRDAERQANKAKRDADRTNKVAHMAKVDKAAKNLPSLSAEAESTVNDIVSSYSSSDITAIIAHLTHRQRATATSKALGAKLEVGQTVRIVSAEGSSARYIGQLATVQVVQRIRCYVNPVGSSTSKRVYLFNSDVVQVSDDELEQLESSDRAGESQAIAV